MTLEDDYTDMTTKMTNQTYITNNPTDFINIIKTNKTLGPINDNIDTTKKTNSQIFDTNNQINQTEVQTGKYLGQKDSDGEREC